MYSQVCMHLDIKYAVGILGRYLYTSGLQVVNYIEKSLMIYCDNKVTELNSKSDKSSSKSKHIDIKFLIIKKIVWNHHVLIEYIMTDFMIMDLLTKDLPHKVFNEHVAHKAVSSSDVLC